MHGYQLLPAVLADQGATVVFGMIAETNAPWLAHGESLGLRFVRCRHEATAVLAAAGYARSKGGVGIATVTRGPGFANAINALASVVDDRVPVVLIVAHATDSYPASQYLEQERITRLLGAGYRVVSAATELRESLTASCLAAHRRGAVEVVAVTESAFEGDAGESSPSLDDGGTDVSRWGNADPPRDAHALALTVSSLTEARHPLLIAGRGAVLADAHEDIAGVAEHLGARLGSTLKAIGAFSGHPLDVGLVGGWAAPAVYDYLRTVDCVVAFGASLTAHTVDQGRLFAQATIIQCLDEPSIRTFRRADVTVHGDARQVARWLGDELAGRRLRLPAPTGPDRDAARRSVYHRPLRDPSATGLDVRDVAVLLEEVLPPDRIVVTDSGRAVVPLPALISAQDAASWHHGRGYGSIGLGLGFAIGAAVAHPTRTVALLVGDGAFLQAAMDLDAAVHAGLANLVIVVLDDGMYGMEVGQLRRFGLPLDVITQPTPDLVSLAQAFGASARAVSSLADLAEALHEPADAPRVLRVLIDPHADLTAAVGRGADANA